MGIERVPPESSPTHPLELLDVGHAMGARALGGPAEEERGGHASAALTARAIARPIASGTPLPTT